MSLGTSNRDGGKTSESGHLRALAKIVDGDVITGLNLSQRAAGVNMSVDVAVGDAFVRRSDGSYAHPVFNDAVYNQVISAADGSNPRRDIVVIYVDYGQAPSTAVSNNINGVVKIKVVNGTPAGSPVDPSDAAIQSSVGAGNPWTKLGRVRVPAGQTSISNTLIDDLRTLTYAKTDRVTTASILALAVTTAKIADAAVTDDKWRNGYAFRVYAVTGNNKSVTGSTFNKMDNMATIGHNIGSAWNAGTQRFVAPVTGIYTFDASLGFPNNDTRGFASLYKNGTEYKRGANLQGSGSLNRCTVSGDIQLTAGDYVELYGWRAANGVINGENFDGIALAGHLVTRT